MLRWAVMFAAAATLSANAQQAHEHPMGARPVAEKMDPGYARFVAQMKAGMDRMMKDMHTPGYTGNADVDFLAMMIPHHEGAVEMARLVLIHGRDPHTRNALLQRRANPAGAAEFIRNSDEGRRSLRYQ